MRSPRSRLHTSSNTPHETAPAWLERVCRGPLAEMLELPLATLDARVARASGPSCPFVLPKATGVRAE